MRSDRAELAALGAVTSRHLNEYYSRPILNPNYTGPQISLRLPTVSSKSTETADKSMKSAHFLIEILTISAPF